MSAELKQFHSHIRSLSRRQHLPGVRPLEGVAAPYGVLINEMAGTVTVKVEGRPMPLAEFVIWEDTPSGVSEAVARATRLIEEHSASR